MTSYSPRQPEAPPSDADLVERDAFQALAVDSLKSVRSSAETWRNGLTAFITLVTTGIVIKGRDTTSDLDVSWRTAVTILIGAGLLCAVLGLWQTLAAQAGARPGAVTLADIRRDHASVAAYQVALAFNAARRLNLARVLVALALALLLSGIATTWWAPTQSASAIAYLQARHDGVTVCGTPETADDGTLHIKVPGTGTPTDISLTRITNLEIVASCSH